METCSVCNEVANYPRGKNVLYICGSCVQNLLGVPAEDRIEAYIEAEKDGDERYLWALGVFIYPRPGKTKRARR